MRVPEIKCNKIIFSDDALLTKRLTNNIIFKNVVGNSVGYISQFLQKDLLLYQIKCTSKNFGELHFFNKEYSAKLGITPPDIYIKQSNEINAYTYGNGEKSFVVVHSKLLDTFNEDEIRFVIGHELGHIAAGHSQILTLTNLFFGTSAIFIEHLPSKMLKYFLTTLQFLSFTIRQWEKAAEITADRYGYLAVKNKKNAYSALINLKIGMINRKEIDIDDYLQQFDQINSNVIYKLNDIRDQLFSTHPNIFRRLMVVKLFHENYSSKELSNKEIDSKIHSLLLGTNRNLLSGSEGFEEIVLKSMIYLAQADGKLDKNEKKLFSKMVSKLNLSDNLKNKLIVLLESSIALEDISYSSELTDFQLEFFSNTIMDVIVADGIYSFDEDIKLISLFDHLKLSRKYLDEKRAIVIKKYGDLTFIKNMLSK